MIRFDELSPDGTNGTCLDFSSRKLISLCLSLSISISFSFYSPLVLFRVRLRFWACYRKASGCSGLWGICYCAGPGRGGGAWSPAFLLTSANPLASGHHQTRGCSTGPSSHQGQIGHERWAHHYNSLPQKCTHPNILTHTLTLPTTNSQSIIK